MDDHRQRDADRDQATAWLKLKGYLFDPVTRLAALPVHLDEIRRRLEGGELLGLLFFDLGHGGFFEPRHGWQAYDEVLASVATALFADCHETDDLLAQVAVRSDELVLVTGLGEADDSNRALEARLGRAQQAVERGLSGAAGPTGTRQPPRVASTALLLEPEPHTRFERTVYRNLAQARAACGRQHRQHHLGRLTELGRMLDERDVTIRYQPIVDLIDGSVLGYEALAAPPSTDVFDTPETLFSFAEETDRIGELERLCHVEAVGRAEAWIGPHRRPRKTTGGSGDGPFKLFLNGSAHIFDDPELVPTLVAHADAARLPTSDIVLELTERVAIPAWRPLRGVLRRIREAGLGLAIDDLGSGYSSLTAVAEVEPDYVKFDLSLISGIDRSRIKRNLLESLVGVAEKIPARAIAEGIERREELDVVRDMGVGYGQGFLFAHPDVPDRVGPVHFPV